MLTKTKTLAPAELKIIPSCFTDELKNSYQKYLLKALIIAVSLHLFIVGAYMLRIYYEHKMKEQEISKQIQQRIITLNDIEPPPSANEDEPPPPLKLETPISPPPKDLSALVPEPVAKEKADLQTIKTQRELDEIKTTVSSTGDSGKFIYSGSEKVEEKKIDEKIVKKQERTPIEKTVFQSFEVEKPPECVNLKQISGIMAYPPLAREAGIEGKVNVKILVGPEGEVVKVGTITGPEAFYEEVSSKVMLLQFTPGLQNGKPVKVWVTVPFNFKLNN